jgi:hypothetical protein
MAVVSAAAQFADVQYELMRLYRTKSVVNNLVFRYDSFFGQLKRKLKKISGQADVIAVAYEGAGVPSNVEGTTGIPNPTKGVQFLVTPVQMTNLAQLSGLAAAGGANGPGTLVQSIKQEIDGAMIKVGRHASVQAWSDGFPAFGQVSATGIGTTTLTLVDPDDISKFAVGDVLNFAAARTAGALKAGDITVSKILSFTAGTMLCDVVINTVAAANDFIFMKNQRNTAATKIAITGVQGWLQATPGTLFGVDTTFDPRLSGIFTAASASDIEGAFIDGIAALMQFSANGAEGITFYMHPKTWATLSKAMQSKTIVVTPYKTTPRKGEISFSGWQVATPNGVVTVFAPQFCPKNIIFGLILDDWNLVSWGTEFPAIVPTQLGAAPGIFQDPTTGNISCMVGGYPQIECVAPGHQLTITLS